MTDFPAKRSTSAWLAALFTTLKSDFTVPFFSHDKLFDAAYPGNDPDRMKELLEIGYKTREEGGVFCVCCACGVRDRRGPVSRLQQILR